ncbi:hypothetical protein ACFYY5_29635 [Nocardia elegans]|uniref:Uncharacterized protein n=1 Tax=Nocardia elegans TaxID=300029 RepID=A0ABW6TNV8_9NOCA
MKNKFFETRFADGNGQEVIQVHPYQEALWAKAFGVEDLADLFDLATPSVAIPKIDEAINRFNHDPETLRPLLDPSDSLKLRGNRMVLEQMRATLADHPDASISGLIDQ